MFTRFTGEDLKRLAQPDGDSHKGSNGRVLVIGGSGLFHASIFWTADVASRFADLVHFSSPEMENNDLVRVKAKEKFWDGIVVPWEGIEDYIEEDDVIVIGPGMPRDDGLMEGERPTAEIVNELLRKFPDKKWVVDGGALQECDFKLLTRSMIVTPHLGEVKRLVDQIGDEFLISNFQFLMNDQFDNDSISKKSEYVGRLSQVLGGVTVLSKSKVDLVFGGGESFAVEGGNAGLTKGGTGDVLAGLVGSFYAGNGAVLAAAAGSFLLKTTADRLAEEVGVNFNTSQLVGEIPKVFNGLV